MLKVLIIDDHPLVRKGVKEVIRESFAKAQVDEAGQAVEALGKLKDAGYGLVLLDLDLPGRGGLDLLKQLTKTKPGLPVLILSIYPEEQYAVRVLKAGASGYLCKDSISEELVAAIKKILSNRKYVSDTLAEKLAVDLEIDSKLPGHGKLSDREFQVLSLFAHGKTTGEIAGKLSLSVKTISTYRSRILEKLRLENNAQLIHSAIKNKLI